MHYEDKFNYEGMIDILTNLPHGIGRAVSYK